jgi:hypothetical protein
MRRILTTTLLMAGVVLAATCELSAQSKTGAIQPGGAVAGTIKAVAKDGKSITVEVPGATKKQAAQTVVIKITADTKIDYTGIDDPEDQKLKVGYTVAVTLEEKSRDKAEEMRVSNKPLTTIKKKKKNK